MNNPVSYNEIINELGEAIFIHNPVNGIIYDVNYPMLAMYGYSKEEIVGCDIEKISSVEEGYTKERANEKIQRALKGNIELFEWKAKKNDGSIFWVEVSLKLAKLNGSEWLIALVRDINEKKKNEFIIHRFTEFQSLLSELSTKFISISNDKLEYEIDFTLRLIGKRLKVDRSYVFIYSNDLKTMSNTNEWCDINSKPFKKKLQNLKVEEFIWHHNTLLNEGVINIPNILEMDESAIKEKQEFLLEGIKSVLIVPLFYNCDIIGFIGIDAVKEQRNWRSSELEELKSFGNIIGQAIIRRIYEKELEKAKEKAEESDRLKSAFLSNMSHEIRTPMNGIVGFSELLEMDDLDQESKMYYIKIIQDSGRHLLSIINDIIDISKIEAGLINLNMEKVDLNELQFEVINFFETIANEKGIELKFINNVPNSSSITETDEVKVKQILTNLISNSIKFTPSGYVALKSAVISNNYVFEIEDSGIGMDEETVKVIFDRFTRSNDNNTAQIQGTGLGLSISKAYAEKLDGRITVTSKKGIGSTFTFYLPLNC